MVLWLSALAAATGLLHIRAEYRGPIQQAYVFKPATTLLILAIAWLGSSADPAYRGLVAAGLVFSLAGDVFLMLPRDRFREGLASFLVAHLLYVAAFTRAEGFQLAPLALAPFAAAAIALFAWLSPHMGSLRLPAAAYMLAIVAMAWQAGAQWLALRTGWALLAFAGATLFVVSDAVLATDRFRGKLASAKLVVLGTYYPAQWLIARSVAQ